MQRTWEEFLAWRAQIQARGEEAALALARGDLAGAAPVLAPWDLEPESPLGEALLDRALRLEEPASPAARAVALAPARALPTPPEPWRRRPDRLWRRWLERHAPPLEASPSPRGRWALTELAWYGVELDRLERRAWASVPRASSKEDERFRALWQAWFRLDDRDQERSTASGPWRCARGWTARCSS